MMSDKVHCSYPFNGVFLSGNAEIKFCCASRSILGNANADKVSEVMHSETAKEIRQAMLNNEWHPNCIVCKGVEQIGGKSMRTREMFNFTPDEIIADIFKLEFLDLRWNNVCNLSCNYCIPEFSNKWAKILGHEITRISRDNEDDLFKFIEKNKDTLTKILMLGGEPLLHLQNLKLTDLIPEAFYYILSNLAIENIENNPNVKKFLTMKYFDWGVSFETIGKKFEYVRHGAKWDTFTHNLKFIQTKINERGNKFSAHPLYSLYSAYNLVEYYDFILEHNFFNGGVHWQALLHNSGGAINNMSKKLIDNAIKEIDKCAEKYPGVSGIDMLLDYKNQLLIDLDKPNDVQYMKDTVEHFNNLETLYLTDKPYKFVDLWPDVWKLLIEGTENES